MPRGYNPKRPKHEVRLMNLVESGEAGSLCVDAVPTNLSSSAAPCDRTIAGDANRSKDACGPARLRILNVTQSYYPFLERGGPAVKVRALAQGLARRGHSVCVLTSDLGIANAANAMPAVSRTAQGWRFAGDGVETLYLSARGRYRSLTWNPAIFGFCRTRLSSFDIAHIYGTYDLLGPFVARACRQKGIPYVLEPMGMFRPIVRNFALKSLYRRFFGGSTVSGALRLVATSLQERAELIEEGISPEKITIRRNGIEVPALPERGGFRRTWKIPQNSFLVLFLGRIVGKKSPELLLAAFDRWRRAGQGRCDSVLVFAGPPESASDARRLKSWVQRLGLTGRVLFTGPLYEHAKWSAFVDADVFVLPSQNENFGNAAAEAVACGTPVIVTDRCGIAPLIEGRAGLVIPHECEALVRALHQLADSALRENLKLGCLDVARGLGWEQPLAETEALYVQLLSGVSTAHHEPHHASVQKLGRQWREEL